MNTYRLIPFTVESTDNIKEKTPEGVKQIKAPEIWDDSDQGEGIVVAILDTGCDKDHPDLKDRILLGKNTTNYGLPNDFSDIDGHGTHVAGTVAGNGTNIFGVAPKARLAIFKVFSPNPDPNEPPGAFNEDIIKAIDECIAWNKSHDSKDRIRVINMSLGSPVDDLYFHDAIKRAVDAGIVFICAAGNEGRLPDPRFDIAGDCDPAGDEYGYPAVYPEVISVGATTHKNQYPCFTNTNLEVDLVAPGVEIFSTYPGGGHINLTGTSMAAPHIAGATALIIKQCESDFGRTLTETEIYAQLIKRTVSLGFDRRIEGNGLLDLTHGYRTFENKFTDK